jgi:hypothetical protein
MRFRSGRIGYGLACIFRLLYEYTITSIRTPKREGFRNLIKLQACPIQSIRFSTNVPVNLRKVASVLHHVPSCPMIDRKSCKKWSDVSDN